MNLKKIIKHIANPISWVILFEAFKKQKGYLKNQEHLDLAVKWLLRAQKENGGFVSRYSLISGYGDEFPEITGYIIPTILKYSKDSAVRAGKWLLQIQNKEGYFCDESGKKPMIFDTGQIIFGLLALYQETKDEKYLNGAVKAGRWIIKNQENNGSWIKFAYNNIPHSYYSRVSLALLMLWKITGDNNYKKSAIKNIDWVLSQQDKDGFYNNASFYRDNIAPLHTIAYTIEGVLESGIILDKKEYINSAFLALNKLVFLNETENSLPGFITKGWKKISRDVCLVGIAQIAILFFRAYELTKNEIYLKNAKKLVFYIKNKQIVSGLNQIKGALAGSDPLWGKYMPMSFPTWAIKFFIDALEFNKKYQNEYLKIAIFPNDPLENYLKKGEIRKDYWNPKGIFREIHVFDNSMHKLQEDDVKNFQFMAGNAKLHIHNGKNAKKILKKENIDVVRAYGLYFTAYMAKNLAKKIRIPFVVSLHTNYDDYRKIVVFGAGQYVKYLKQIIWKLLFEIKILKSAQKIIAVYNFAALYPRSLGIPQEKISIIYNKVSQEIFFQNKTIDKKTKFTLINVNSFIDAKNQEVLIRAVQYADFNLILVGNGPTRKKLINLAKKLNVQDKIKFIASVPNIELPNIYNQCHAYASIIKIGGIGIGAIEAMACGLPIITGKSDRENEPELLGFDNCIFVKNNPKDIAEKISHLMIDKKYYDEMSQKSLNIYSQINGEKMAQKEKELYLNIL